jgi:hypothetical protein
MVEIKYWGFTARRTTSATRTAELFESGTFTYEEGRKRNTKEAGVNNGDDGMMAQSRAHHKKT